MKVRNEDGDEEEDEDEDPLFIQLIGFISRKNKGR